jgi:hypothetical protein
VKRCVPSWCVLVNTNGMWFWMNWVPYKVQTQWVMMTYGVQQLSLNYFVIWVIWRNVFCGFWRQNLICDTMGIQTCRCCNLCCNRWIAKCVNGNLYDFKRANILKVLEKMWCQIIF